MLVVFILLCLASSWIWVNYFKEIKVIQKEKLPYIILTFSLGASLYFLLNYFTGASLNHFAFFKYNVFNKLIDSILRVGFFNEILKLVPIYIVYRFFKKELNESVSIFLFFTVSALGYSFSGNIYHAFHTEIFVFNEYSILNTLNEVFCSSLVSFAVINYRFYNKKIWNVISYLTLAIFLSGFYDFWLYFERINPFGFLISILYFLFFISAFSSGLTSTINISSNFSYLQIESSKLIFKRFFFPYLLIVFLQFFAVSFFKDLNYSSVFLIDTLWFSVIILFFTAKRLSKFKLIKGRWKAPKLELPFTFFYSESFNGRKPKLKFKFRGETFNEKAIDFYLGSYCSINPLSKRDSFILKPKDSFIAEKIFLKNDETYYLLSVLLENKMEVMLLKPKKTGKNLIKRRHAICALLSIPEGIDFRDVSLTHADFIFREWVFVKYR